MWNTWININRLQPCVRLTCRCFSTGASLHNTLQHTATHCNTPQHSMCRQTNSAQGRRSALQCIAVHCRAVCCKRHSVLHLSSKKILSPEVGPALQRIVSMSSYFKLCPPNSWSVLSQNSTDDFVFTSKLIFFETENIVDVLLFSSNSSADSCSSVNTATHCSTLQLQSNETCPSALACKSSFVWKGVMSSLPAICCSVL